MPSARRTPHQDSPVVAAATRLLEQDDLAAAQAYLRRELWFAKDRGSAALLLFGCHVAHDDHAAGLHVLRRYLEKTPAVRSVAEAIAERLLRHHATGGGLRARSAREAAYFGLYALRALDEPDTARADLSRAARDAPRAERALLAAAEARR